MMSGLIVGLMTGNAGGSRRHAAFDYAREGNDHGDANFNVSLLLGVPPQLKLAPS